MTNQHIEDLIEWYRKGIERHPESSIYSEAKIDSYMALLKARYDAGDTDPDYSDVDEYGRRWPPASIGRS